MKKLPFSTLSNRITINLLIELYKSLMYGTADPLRFRPTDVRGSPKREIFREGF